MNQNNFMAAASTITAWMVITFLFLLTAAGIKWAWGLLFG
jgi:hypothetical protein